MSKGTEILCPICEEELQAPGQFSPRYWCPDCERGFTLHEIAQIKMEHDKQTGAFEPYKEDGD